MIEFLQNFHFLRPWILLFLALPLLFYLKNIRLEGKISSWENVCDKNLLNFLLIHKGKHKKLSLRKFFYVGLLSCIIGAAGPAWKKVEIPTFTIENPSMFVLSLARDMQLTDITPSRLDRAKFMISDIANHFPDGQFGLEVYSQEPYIISPITDDIKIIKSLLSQITPDIVPDQGDRLDRAIDLAIERFKTANYSSGHIILFASDVGQRLDFAIDAAQKAARLNYSINVIDTSFSGNDKLQMLAEKGNGVYLSVKDARLDKLISKINEKNQEKIQLSQNLRSNFLDYGYYLVFLGLICMLPFFRRGLLILCIFCLFSMEASAGFLLNDNQEGLKLFNSKQYELAFQKFKDSIWKGLSLYKQEKKEEALKEFEKNKTDVGLYNAGVVLTKLCQYEKALSAFSEALKLNPKNEDALYNKKVLEDLFEKAKDDPSVLSCSDNQQQNNQNNQKNEDNQQQDSDQQNQSQNDKEQQENSDNQDNQNNDQSEEQEQQQQSSSDTPNNENNNSAQNQEPDKGQQDKDSQQDSAQSQEKSDSDKNNDEAPSQEDNNKENQDKENQNTPQKANKDDGGENKSDNKEGDDDNATDMQEQEAEVPVMNAKEGDEDTQYDEEALAIRRKYREIPEDPGGLLREFIKKEYLKDRYHDENK